MFKRLLLPVLLICSVFAVLSPAAAFARDFGGLHGYSGGHSFSAMRGYSGGHAFTGRSGNFDGRDLRFRGDRDHYYRGYGLGLGFGYAPYAYGYAPGYCDPAGYYDQWGYWHPSPGCYIDPYGY